MWWDYQFKKWIIEVKLMSCENYIKSTLYLQTTTTTSTIVAVVIIIIMNIRVVVVAIFGLTVITFVLISVAVFSCQRMICNAAWAWCWVFEWRLGLGLQPLIANRTWNNELKLARKYCISWSSSYYRKVATLTNTPFFPIYAMYSRAFL